MPEAALIDEAGVTRLADLTGLDCLGLPVWQAVRPWSRALSTHQGKGMTEAAARRGAVMEAIESHHAERWLPDPGALRRAAWRDLPPAERAPAADDFGIVRSAPDAARAIDWVMVEPLGDSARFHVPVACVALDCTRTDTPELSTDSNGQAAHLAFDAALLAGLLELIERDAVGEWLAGSLLTRAGSEVDAGRIEDAAVRSVVARLEARSIALSLYEVRGVVPVPVFVAELRGAGRQDNLHERAWGSAARPDRDAAILAALLEAAQTRCTLIAGARDTIPLDGTVDDGALGTFRLPRADGWRGHRPSPPGDAPRDVAGIVAALARAGYPQAGYVRLDPPGSRAVTVKAFVPGLGFETRRRRAA